MSEYYLKYYELNKSKNDLIRNANKINSIARQYDRVKSGLSGQRGLGIDTVRQKLDHLAKKSEEVGSDLKDIGTFLETVLRETEAADHEAEKILKKFSLDALRQFLKFLQKLLQNFKKLIIGWVGGDAKACGDIGAKWGADIAGVGLDAKGEDGLFGALGKLLGGISGLIVKSFGQDAPTTGPVTIKSSFNTNGFIASWVAGVVGDTFENFTDGQGTVGEDIGESVVEGLLEGAKALGIAALSAVIIGAIGLSGGAAAAVAVGVGIGVGWAMDLVSEQIFHNDLGLIENVGDVICDWFSQLAF